jgi:glutamine synthetase
MCNPYLLLAGILASGLDGIRRQIMPPSGIGAGADEVHPDLLPRDLQEANACLLADPLLCDTLGSPTVDRLARIAELECDEFRTAVHPWELRRYFQAA